MTDFRYHAVDSGGKIVFSNLEPAEMHILEGVMQPSVLIQNECIRAGCMQSDSGKVYAVSRDKDYLRSSQKFKTTLGFLLNSLKYLRVSIGEHSEAINVSTRRLIHNLTSLNAHNIQEIYSLVPQELLAKRTRGHIDFIQKIVSESPREVAVALMAIARANASMKTEFSVFKNLFNPEPIMQKKDHVVHKVLMNVLYVFFPDFTDKDVHVAVSESTLSAWFDYESVHVAFYHLIDNAAKYVKPSSDMYIEIVERDGAAVIIFNMRSLKISDVDVEMLFEEGYSGDLAVKTGKAGGGIGTSLIKKVLELNSGTVSVKIYPETIETVMGISYQDNVFEVILPRRAGGR